MLIANAMLSLLILLLSDDLYGTKDQIHFVGWILILDEREEDSYFKYHLFLLEDLC